MLRVPAATFYTCLFQDHPKNLDWRIYNDQQEYLNKNGRICCEKDLEVHLEITPARARIVNGTIWEVVTGHAYTGLRKED